jgi:hypothetical protein
VEARPTGFWPEHLFIEHKTRPVTLKVLDLDEINYTASRRYWGIMYICFNIRTLSYRIPN